MKSQQKTRTSCRAVPVSGQSSDASRPHTKASMEGKPRKEVNKSNTRKPEENNASISKAHAHRKFKRKPWQKYNARVVGVQDADGADSSDSDKEEGKYKKREIVDINLRFEAPEDEEDKYLMKEVRDEEERDFSELCEHMRVRENPHCGTEDEAKRKSKMPVTLVLPEDFEKDLDHLLTLNVPQHELPTSTAYDDPESFSKWLEEC